jgi:hypothetical protein
MLVLSFVIISMALTALAIGERFVNKETMKDLIVHYFSAGYKNKEILASLLLIHGIKISYRHLKGIIWKLIFHSRTVESNNEDMFSCNSCRTIWEW